MAEAEQSRIAEQQIVSGGVGGQHEDAREVAMVIIGQHELQREQAGEHRQMQQQSAPRAGMHQALALPNRPAGRNTSTSATNKVAMILARVGEKKTEITPSL